MYASLVAYLKLMPAQVKITLSADEKKQLEKKGLRGIVWVKFGTPR